MVVCWWGCVCGAEHANAGFRCSAPARCLLAIACRYIRELGISDKVEVIKLDMQAKEHKAQDYVNKV